MEAACEWNQPECARSVFNVGQQTLFSPMRTFLSPKRRCGDKWFYSWFNFPPLHPETLTSGPRWVFIALLMNNVSCMRTFWIWAVWPKDNRIKMICLEKYVTCVFLVFRVVLLLYYFLSICIPEFMSAPKCWNQIRAWHRSRKSWFTFLIAVLRRNNK